MIEISNLRLEKGAEWTKLLVDITAEREILPDNTMWFALPNKYADMFNIDTYDPFLLVPYYMGMFYGQDVKVHGNISKLFYKNLTEGIGQILDGFSDHTQKVRLTADGFCKVTPDEAMIGTSGSCGIDSLCSIYDHYVYENDPEYPDLGGGCGKGDFPSRWKREGPGGDVPYHSAGESYMGRGFGNLSGRCGGLPG